MNGPNIQNIMENQFVKLTISDNGCVKGLVDKVSGVDYCATPGEIPLFSVQKPGKTYDASKLTLGQTA